MTERCPNCGSSSYEMKSAMMERNFAVCHVTYCECNKCGKVWEPKRTIHLKLGYGRDKPTVDIPDGSTIRIRFPNGTVRESRIDYLDETHVTLNGNTYHIDQIRDSIENHPGTTVEIVGQVASKSKRKLFKSKSSRFGDPCPICGERMGKHPSRSKWDRKQRICPNCRNRQEQEAYLNGVVSFSKKPRFFVLMKRGKK